MSPNLINKAKQFFFVLIKVSIVILAFYFIYKTLFKNPNFTLATIYKTLKNINILWWFLIIILSLLNWELEIKKWQTLVRFFTSISYKEALKQSLASFTSSIITPNRVGEYAVKALYYNKENTKTVLSLNLLGNFSQLVITLLLGCLGIGYIINKYPKAIPETYLPSNITLYLILLAIPCFYILFKVAQKRFNIKLDTALIYKVTGISTLKYICFSFQFILMLHLLNIETSYIGTIALVTAYYFLVSVIPTIGLFDVVVKGSIGINLFNTVQFSSEKIAIIITSLWILNTAIPAVLGSYYILLFNRKTKKAVC